MSWFGNIAKNIFSGTNPPNKVLDVKSSQYSDRVIVFREDSLVLYGPNLNDKKYEIVILRPYCEQAYSVFRSEQHEEAETTFIQLKDTLPGLISISTSVNTQSGIQKICDTIKENPSWNIAHVVVYLNLSDCLNSEQFLSHLNSSDAFTGLSPLQLAIKQENLATVRSLVASNASLEHLDNDSNSVFHFAASTNKDIIMALLTNGQPKCLNIRNTSGYTPLHIACLQDKPDCVQTLLSKGADVNICATHGETSSLPPGYVGDFMQGNTRKLDVQEMKFGGTPLHWSCSREVIEQLVDRNCDMNVLNFDKRTALHVMVIRNRLQCVVALLSRFADVDMPDGDGNTALHLAVKGRNVYIVQALIVFGADLAFMNHEGHTPRHLAAQDQDPISRRILYLLHAVGAPRCGNNVHGCTDGCMCFGEENGLPPPVPQSAKVRAIMKWMESLANSSTNGNVRGGRILCLDGGGIRGLVLIIILLYLETHAKQPIIHCFDWVSGTSTGAILALALAAGKTLRECLCLYFRMKEYAFCGMKPYPSEPLEIMLQQALGSDSVMADIKHPKVIITGVLSDRKPVDLHLFRNYQSASEMVDPHDVDEQYAAPPPMHEQLLWKAARASGAAPSYFRAFGRFIDGGLIANNPTMDTLTEIHEYNTALKIVGRGEEAIPPTVVVSVGTGCVPVTKLNGVDIYRPENLMDTARLAMGLSSLGKLLVDQATLADGRVIDRCSAWCSMINVPYFRFSPQLSEDVALDEKSDEKLVNMLWETKSYIYSNDEVIQRLASILKCEEGTGQGERN